MRRLRPPRVDRDALKRAAAEPAVQMVESDMVVGLGSGSTAAFAVEALARRHRQGLRFLGSQVDTLEEPDPSEDPLTVDLGASAAQLAHEIIRLLGNSVTIWQAAATRQTDGAGPQKVRAG
jgi:gluconate kinase